MSDPLIARFADACGATAPLDLRVDLAGGGLLAEGSVSQPFTLVGRDDSCDVTLSDPEINLRHAWVQVIGGRAFMVDLGSRTGLLWPNGARGSGWLDPGTPVRIGPFLFRLRGAPSDKPSHYTPGYNPLAADTDAKARPVAALEFRNGRRARDKWSVNRLITLIGRAPDCKIHLTADDISPYHCGIVSTRTGMWVVDLSGRGVVVNGERMRVAPLPQSAELWVGRFLIGCQYQVPPAAPKIAPAPPAGKSGRLSSAPRPANAASATTPHASPAAAEARSAATATPPSVPAPPKPPSDDEVELGTEPEVGGLPASHIMADAFNPWGPNASGPVSHPIHVSGSGPKTPPGGIPGAMPDESLPGASDDWSIGPLLRQMADLHGRSVAEFQQTLTLVAQMFVRVKREHLAVLLHELTRIQELTAEITAIQAEVALQATELAANDRAKQTADGPKSESWASPSTRTPLPDPPLTPRPPAPPQPEPTTPNSAAARAAERLATLQQDRAARWQALIVLFTGA